METLPHLTGKTMLSLDTLYFSSFDKKLLTAHQLYGRYGKALKTFAALQEAIARLETYAAALARTMENVNFGQFCGACAVKTGGGCCSVEMAGEGDALLFLINLLAGCEVTVQRRDGFECYLLGAKGCTLRYKPIFCLNYNCYAVQSSHKEGYADYLAASATILRCQLDVEQLLYGHLKGLVPQE